MSFSTRYSRLVRQHQRLRPGCIPAPRLLPTQTRHCLFQTSTLRYQETSRSSPAQDLVFNRQEPQNRPNPQDESRRPHWASIICWIGIFGGVGYACYCFGRNTDEYLKLSAELSRRNRELRLRIEDLERTQYTIEYATDDRTKSSALSEIRRAIGGDNVSCDQRVIEQHSHSEWSTSIVEERPIAVVYPKSTLDVVKIAKVCHEYRIPMIPFGGGSSVEGHVSSPHSGICVDFTNMNKIFEFQPDDMAITVHPGVNWVDLNDEIAHTGLFLPLDPSSTAQIGGMVATNCSGTNSLRYGTMKDWVMNLTVVLADGSVVKTKRMSPKNSAGYDLTSWFVGTEGTLGMITEITLKLASVPAVTSVAVVSFDSIKEAASAAQHISRSGVQLAALDMMDDVQMQVLNKHGSAAVRDRAWDEKPTLFLKFAGTESSVKSDIADTKAILASSNADALHLAEIKQEEVDVWAARKEAFRAMYHARPKGASLCYAELSVPPSCLAEITSQNKIAKISVCSRAQSAVRRMRDRVLAIGGTISGNYGIGIGKKDALVSDLGVETIDFIKKVKESLDPRWIMNPGKVIDIPNYTPKSWGWKGYYNVGSGLKEDRLPIRLALYLDDEDPIL